MTIIEFPVTIIELVTYNYFVSCADCGIEKQIAETSYNVRDKKQINLWIYKAGFHFFNDELVCDKCWNEKMKCLYGDDWGESYVT